jgi:rhamnogalacturonan endolyase
MGEWVSAMYNTIDYRNAQAVVLGGPEWLTVFSGATGEELATVEYPVLYGSSDWGDLNGNRSNRYNGGVSFVSDTGAGKTATGRPSIIQQRGYYTRLTVSAHNWRDGALTKVWTYDSGATAGNEAYGKGNHSLMTADVGRSSSRRTTSRPTWVSTSALAWPIRPGPTSM